jgi:hypothetical protein
MGALGVDKYRYVAAEAAQPSFSVFGSGNWSRLEQVLESRELVQRVTWKSKWRLPPALECQNGTYTLSVTGAACYSWEGP